MTPAQAAEIRTRALRQIVRECVSVHITARQVEDLACAYLDAYRRLAQITTTARHAQYELADHQVETVAALLVEIEQGTGVVYSDIEP